MKHIVFEFSEPIVAIQRVCNEVFPSGDRTITVYNYNMMHRIVNVLRDMYIECTMTSNSEIVLSDEYYIVIDINSDEFTIVRGNDDMKVLDAHEYIKYVMR